MSLRPLIWAFLIVGLLMPGVSRAQHGINDVQFVIEDDIDRKVVYLHRAQAPPTVDGDLAEPWWQDAVVSAEFSVGGVRPSRNATMLKAAYDETHLYFGVTSYFGHLNQLKREKPSDFRGTQVWSDDCLDFKVSADGGITNIQFLVNANGAWGALHTADPNWQATGVEVAAKTSSEAYTVEMAIPLDNLGLERLDEQGAVLTLIFGRADRTAAPTELSTALGEKWDETRTAPLYVLASSDKWGKNELLASFSPAAIGGTVDSLNIYLDRDSYPSFRSSGMGRIHVATSPGDPLSQRPVLELRIHRDGELVSSRTIDHLRAPKVDFEFGISDLSPGSYQLVAVFKDGGHELARAAKDFHVQPARAPDQTGSIAIEVPAVARPWARWPITFGVPFPSGALDHPDHVMLVDEAGVEMPMEARVAARWSNAGSVKWLHVTFLPEVGPTVGRYELIYGPQVQRAQTQPAAMVTTLPDHFSVDTGRIRFKIPRTAGTGLSEVSIKNRQGRYVSYFESSDGGAVMVDDQGRTYAGSNDSEATVTVEENSSLKAVIKVAGYHKADDGSHLGKFILRYHAWRDLPFIEMHHTFIVTEDPENQRYRNIRYTLPIVSRDYFFGTDKGHVGRVAADGGAYLIQLDDQRHKIYQDGVFVDEGGKTAGLLTAGRDGRRVTVAVRDFWQNFPKELEVTGDAVHIHMWPRHGEESPRLDDELSIRNVYQQWFVHAGKILDFKIPENVLSLVKQDSEAHNYPHAQVVHAMGLAKTHETLLYFHDDEWEGARAYSVGENYDDHPIAVVCPKWVAASGVFGSMHHRDPQQFPQVEQALDTAFDFIARQQAMDRDYGMFNYGNAHHNWISLLANERRWSLHRIWYNTHHGWTRWPWLMYGRSGDKRIFDYARANAMMAADIAHCHYATDRYVRENYPVQKIVGGIHDYKGFSPWSAGGRLGYNSAADALLWHYYFTGNMRSLETALAHGEALLDHGRSLPRREGSGRVTSAIELYQHTWDNRYLEFIDGHIETLLRSQQDDGSFPQWEDFAPFLQRYVQLTGSQRAMDAMARWADSEVDRRTTPAGHHAKISVLAHAYMYSQVEQYLQVANYRVSLFSDHIHKGEDPRYDGMLLNFPGNMNSSYFMQWAPYYLKALAMHGSQPESHGPRFTLLRTFAQETINDRTYYVVRALIQRGNQPMTVVPRVTGVDRYLLSVVPIGQPAEPQAVQAITIPGDGPQQYEVLILSEQRNFHIELPLLEEPAKGAGEMYVHHPSYMTYPHTGTGMPFYFKVPEHAEKLEISFQVRHPLLFKVIAPDGQVVAKDEMAARRQGTLQVDVTGQPRDNWRFNVYGRAGVRLEFKAIPSSGEDVFYYSLDPERLFDPQ